MRYERRVGSLTFFRVFSTTLFLFFHNTSNSQSSIDLVSYGSRSKSLGENYATLTDFWSSLNNPATLSLQTNKYLIGAYYENSYLAKELSQTSIGFSSFSKLMNYGISLSRIGLKAYNQGDASLIIGKKLSNRISIGTKIRYHYIQAPQVGSVAAFTGEVGLYGSLSDKFTVGLHIANPTNETIGKAIKDPLPSALTIGLSYFTPWQFTIFSEFQKSSSSNLAVKTGIEWNIFLNLNARLGYKSNPNVLSFGFGYILNNFSFDMSLTKHEVLGFSPQLAATFWINNNRTGGD